ncbi:MAG TPA: GNAT family N-acetyltransferase [Blastocatellia bacterium]|nr:GNAT family N-acetyltransferase [Blastocatellia bacterium]
MHTLAQAQTSAEVAESRRRLAPMLGAQRLTSRDEAEVRHFLAQRPLQTFGLLGMISDNGLDSPHNRGDFYAYRGARREIEGVALIGHNTMLDARSDEAIESFTELAKATANPFLLLAPEPQMVRFVEHYADALCNHRAMDYYDLFDFRGTPADLALSPLPGVRLAAPGDLAEVVRATNQCGIEEIGSDSLALDAAGFTARCARRIARGRTWMWAERGRLIMKLDVITLTHEVAYLESLWVHPDARRKGYGARFLNQVSEQLQRDSASVCFLAAVNKGWERSLYRKAGYVAVDRFGVVFCDRAKKQ